MKILNLAIDDYVHTIATIPQTMLVGKAFQLLNCPFFYVLFGVLPNVRPGYPHGHLWGIDGKFGTVLRIETVANNVSFVKQRRRVGHRERT